MKTHTILENHAKNTEEILKELEVEEESKDEIIPEVIKMNKSIESN